MKAKAAFGRTEQLASVLRTDIISIVFWACARIAKVHLSHHLSGANGFVNIILPEVKCTMCFTCEIPECVRCQMSAVVQEDMLCGFYFVATTTTTYSAGVLFGHAVLRPASVVAPACSCFDFAGHTFHCLYLSLAFCFKARNKSYDVLRIAFFWWCYSRADGGCADSKDATFPPCEVIQLNLGFMKPDLRIKEPIRIPPAVAHWLNAFPILRSSRFNGICGSQ